MSDGDYPDSIAKSIEIEASPATVWRALTDPLRMPLWMSDEPLTVEADWAPGGAVVSRGVLHGRLRFENRGTVRVFEPERVLEYSHWNSLSRRVLPDRPEHHVLQRFALRPAGAGTRLDLELRNLGNYAVYGHLNYYWEVALAALKRYAETGSAAPR